MQVLYPGWTGIWRCWFLWREENRRTRKNPRSKARTHNKLGPYLAPGRNRTVASLMGGERSKWSTRSWGIRDLSIHIFTRQKFLHHLFYYEIKTWYMHENGTLIKQSFLLRGYNFSIVNWIYDPTLYCEYFSDKMLKTGGTDHAIKAKQKLSNPSKLEQSHLNQFGVKR